jgi:hypothetical protein
MGQLVWVLVIWGPDGLTGVTLSCVTCGAHMESYGQSGQNHSVKVITHDNYTVTIMLKIN